MRYHGAVPLTINRSGQFYIPTMDLSNNSARDFVLNESFQKWILDPDEETTAFWNAWTTAHPHKAEIVEEARMMILNIKGVLERNVECDRDEVWKRIAKDTAK